MKKCCVTSLGCSFAFLLIISLIGYFSYSYLVEQGTTFSAFAIESMLEDLVLHTFDGADHNELVSYINQVSKALKKGDINLVSFIYRLGENADLLHKLSLMSKLIAFNNIYVLQNNSSLKQAQKPAITNNINKLLSAINSGTIQFEALEEVMNTITYRSKKEQSSKNLTYTEYKLDLELDNTKLDNAINLLNDIAQMIPDSNRDVPDFKQDLKRGIMKMLNNLYPELEYE